MCKLLSHHGADIEAKGQNKMKALHFAARYGDKDRVGDVWDCMQWIMGEYRERKKAEEKRKMGMSMGIIGKKETHAYDIKEKDKYDFNVLHHAVAYNNSEAAKILLEKYDFDVNLSG